MCENALYGLYSRESLSSSSFPIATGIQPLARGANSEEIIESPNDSSVQDPL